MKFGKKDNEIANKIRGAGKPFLLSEEWKALRREVINKYGERCMRCKRLPKRPSHVNVDHIRCRDRWPELRLDFDNLQVLCKWCNKAKGNGRAIDYRPRA